MVSWRNFQTLPKIFISFLWNQRNFLLSEGRKWERKLERLHYLGVCPGDKLGFPGVSDGKESACNAGDLGSIPGSGGSPREGNGSPLQYSCMENSMEPSRLVCGVSKESDMTEQLSCHFKVVSQRLNALLGFWSSVGHWKPLSDHSASWVCPVSYPFRIHWPEVEILLNGFSSVIGIALSNCWVWSSHLYLQSIPQTLPSRRSENHMWPVEAQHFFILVTGWLWTRFFLY